MEDNLKNTPTPKLREAAVSGCVLELRHLAPYLPYGLKGNYMLSDIINLLSGQKDEVRSKILSTDSATFFLIYCTPILRPLSDLTKEIEEDVNIYSCLSLRSKNDFDDGNPLLLKWSYEDIQKLLKHHFDVFGLIAKGLALSIHDVD